MKYKVKFTKKFKKDYKLTKRQSKNLDKLFYVIEKLANGENLSEKYNDHALTDDLKGLRECHIEPNWLLIYEYIDDKLILMLTRLGSHSDLFNM